MQTMTMSHHSFQARGHRSVARRWSIYCNGCISTFAELSTLRPAFSDTTASCVLCTVNGNSDGTKKHCAICNVCRMNEQVKHGRAKKQCTDEPYGCRTKPVSNETIYAEMTVLLHWHQVFIAGLFKFVQQLHWERGNAYRLVNSFLFEFESTVDVPLSLAPHDWKHSLRAVVKLSVITSSCAPAVRTEKPRGMH